MNTKKFIEQLLAECEQSWVHRASLAAAGFSLGILLGLPRHGLVPVPLHAWMNAPQVKELVLTPAPEPRVMIRVAWNEAVASASSASSVPATAYAVPAVPSAYTAPALPRSNTSSVAPVLHPAAQESSSSVSSLQEVPVPAVTSDFPAFGNAVQPVARVPNWGAMTTPAQWSRSYSEMTDDDFVAIPRYDLSVLTTPTVDLMSSRENPTTITKLTAKLYYSTRFFGKYDLDAGEFTGNHPGVDLKLPLGTPVGAVAGGRVHDVRSSAVLGTYVVIEHRHPTAGTFYSIYGHLGSARVKAGDVVTSGQMIGTVGMTGNTGAPHVHLQIDRGQPGEAMHEPYLPASIPSPAEAGQHVINPITFISQY